MGRVQLQCAFHELGRLLQVGVAFAKFRQRNKDIGRGPILRRSPVEVTLRHPITSEFLTAPPGLRQGFHFSPRDPNRFFQASFRLAVVVSQSVGPAQIQLDAGVGRIQARGAFQSLYGLLIILPLPSLCRFLEHPGERPFGNPALSFHWVG